jgi:hypothetical protein
MSFARAQPILPRFEVKQYKRVLATHARPSYARMIPKSGYRFSDKIMRKKDHSQNRPAEQDRVTPEPAVGPVFGSIMLCEQVARMERSAIRERWSGSDAVPGFHFVQPGLQTTNKREAERRQAH